MIYYDLYVPDDQTSYFTTINEDFLIGNRKSIFHATMKRILLKIFRIPKIILKLDINIFFKNKPSLEREKNS